MVAEYEKIHIPRLEIRAAEHCNLTCKGCSQNSPFVAESFPLLSQTSKNLSLLSKFATIDKIVVLGGEPLLNPNLEALVKTIKTVGHAKTVSLITNGIMLSKMPASIWEVLDEVVVSVYPATQRHIQKSILELVQSAFQANTELRLIPNQTFNHIGVATQVEPYSLVRRLFSECYFKDYTTTLFDGHLYRCAPCINIDTFHIGGIKKAEDGIRLVEKNNFGSLLKSYLSSKEPLQACKYCLGTSGASFPHSQMGAKNARPLPFQYSLLTFNSQNGDS